MCSLRKIITIILFLASSFTFLLADDYLIERRKEQFLKEEGYLVIPAPYSMPGIGQGLAVYGGFNNYFGYSDIFAVKTNGDVDGNMLGIWDVHLIQKTLFFDFMYFDFDKVGTMSYFKRGMQSKKEDHSIIELDMMRFFNIKSTLSFFDRRFEFIARYNEDESRIARILDSDEKAISIIADQKIEKNTNISFASTIDITDDRQDPLKGFRANLDVDKTTPDSSFSPEFYILTSNLTSYIPIKEKNTLVFNYFRSDSYVLKQGEKSEALILAEVKDPSLVNSTLNYNKYGDARALGGESILRAYPSGRFKGAHTQLVGAEYRWNLTAERKPVDLYFMRDIRTGVQFAFFYEVGSVADVADEIWKETRSASGVGARFIMGSGFVYRFDFAFGNEGYEVSIFANYPWEDI